MGGDVLLESIILKDVSNMLPLYVDGGYNITNIF